MDWNDISRCVGYQLMLDYGFGFQNLWPMVLIFVIAVVTILLVLRKIKKQMKPNFICFVLQKESNTRNLFL